MFYSSKDFKIFIIFFFLFVLSVIFNNCFSDPDHSIIDRPSSSDRSSESMENLKRSITHQLKDLVPGVDYVPGEVILKLKEPFEEEETFLEETSNVLGKISSNRQASLKPIDSEKKIFLYKGSPSLSVSDGIAAKAGEDFINTIVALNQDPRVEYAEPNYFIRNPPFFSNFNLPKQGTSLEEEEGSEDFQFLESHPDEITTQEEVRPRSSSLSASTFGSSRDPVIVAVLDSGIDTNHPYFKKYDAFWENPGEVNSMNGQDDDQNGYIDDIQGWNFVNNSNDIQDAAAGSGHGTMVSGPILRSVYQHFSIPYNVNLLRQPLAPLKIKIMSLKISDTSGETHSGRIYDAVQYAIKNGAKIINLSFGGNRRSNTNDRYVKAACENNILFIASSGNKSNDNDKRPHDPASLNFPNLISVAALNASIQEAHENRRSFSLWRSSNYGDETVYIAAPGERVLVPVPPFIKAENPDLNAFRVSGTSFSAPVLAGLAAEVLYHYRNLLPHQLKEIIFLSSIYKRNLAALLITGKHTSFQNIHDLSSLDSIVQRVKNRTNDSQPICENKPQTDPNPGGNVWQPTPPGGEEPDIPIENEEELQKIINSEFNNRKFGGCLSINSFSSNSEKKKSDSLPRNRFSILFLVIITGLPFLTYLMLYRRAKKMNSNLLIDNF